METNTEVEFQAPSMSGAAFYSQHLSSYQLDPADYLLATRQCASLV